MHYYGEEVVEHLGFGDFQAPFATCRHCGFLGRVGAVGYVFWGREGCHGLDLVMRLPLLSGGFLRLAAARVSVVGLRDVVGLRISRTCCVGGC